MMKKILFGVGIIICLVVVAGFLAPTKFHIEREIVINKPKAEVFNYLKIVKNADKWSPWMMIDPNVMKEYAGTDGTVGFIAAWSGNDEIGEGEQEIMKLVEGERMDSELRFKRPMQSVATTYFITEDSGANQTKVKWGFDSESSFPFNLLCLIMNMQNTMEKEFDKGLTNLKVMMETEPPPPSPASEKPAKKSKKKKS